MGNGNPGGGPPLGAAMLLSFETANIRRDRKFVNDLHFPRLTNMAARAVKGKLIQLKICVHGSLRVFFSSFCYFWLRMSIAANVSC